VVPSSDLHLRRRSRPSAATLFLNSQFSILNSQVEQKLDVPLRPLHRTLDHADDFESEFDRRLCDGVDGNLPDGFVAHDSFFCVARTDFELRFDEGDRLGRSGEDPPHGREDVAKRDEGDVDAGERERIGEVLPLEVAGIHFLAIHHTRIVAQLLVELTMSDVDRVDLRRSMRQHDVGEAAGRGADVDADSSGEIDGEVLDRLGQLHPPAADPWMLELFDPYLVVLGHGMPGFVDMPFIHDNAACHDETLRLRPRVDETSIDQGNVESLLRRLHPWKEMIANLQLPLEPLTLLERRLLLLLTAALAVLRFLALAATPWDWDELLFMNALREFDVTVHHPHPPGFPLFIAAAKLVRTIVPDDFRALQSIGFVASVLLFPALVWLGREMRFPNRLALSGGLLCSVLPNVVIFGGSAFSDVTSLTLVVSACAALLGGCRDRRLYFLGTLLLAIAIGVRTQNLLVGFVPGVLATWVRLRRRWWDPILALLLGVAVVGGAYGGAAIASRSPSAYLDVVEAHGRYVRTVDAIGAPTRVETDIARQLFLHAYRAGSLNSPLLALAVVGLVAALRRRESSMLLLLATFGPMLGVIWLLLDFQSLGRFTIAVTPLFAFATARGVAAVAVLSGRHGSRLEAAISGFFALALVAWVVPAVSSVRAPSPPFAAAEWIRRNVARGERLYVTSGLRPLAEYYFGAYRWVLIETDQSGRIGEKGTLITDEDVVAPGRGITFERSRKRLGHVVRRYYFKTRVLPVEETIGFVDGWYDQESSGNDTWRWMGRRAAVELPPLKGPVRLRLDIAVPIDCTPAPPTVYVRLNGSPVGEIRPRTIDVVAEFDATATRPTTNILEFEVSEVCNPKRQGVGEDGRDLGLLLRDVTWRPLGN
jgi:hypothetical protein